MLFGSLSAAAAPELSDADRERLADGTSDYDAVLDKQDGLYVLLRNAKGWMGDDFSGDRGAAVAPPPDYQFLKTQPAEARGNVYLIEGWLAQADRYPSQDTAGREQLHITLDPGLGKQVTRWTLVTDKDDPRSTVIVLFHDPNAKMKPPEAGTELRIAARFYKLWMIKDVEGKPFTYPVFVGGAEEVVSAPAGGALSTGSTPGRTMLLLGIIVVAGGFFVVRYVLSRGGGGSKVRERLNEIRRERERYESDGDDEAVEDLPDDPVDALNVLSERHEP